MNLSNVTDKNEARAAKINLIIQEIQSGNEDLYQILWEQIEPLCHWVSKKLYRSYPESYRLEYDDIFNCGFIALHKAVDKFDIDRGGKFSKIFLFEFINTVFQFNHLPRGRLQNPKTHGGDNRKTDPVLSKGTLSLDEMIAGGDKEGSVYDILPSDGSTGIEKVEQRIYNQQLHNALEKLLNQLDSESEQVIREKYYGNFDSVKIATKFQMPLSRTRDIEEKALIKLRKSGHKVGLESFLNDNINYYAGTNFTRFKESCESSTERLAIRRIALTDRYNKIMKLAEDDS